MPSDGTKRGVEQLKSHGILLKTNQIGYIEIPKCNKIGTHYYHFVFCRGINEKDILTACESHSQEIENYLWRISTIGLNMLIWFDEQLSTGWQEWADLLHQLGYIPSFLNVSPIVDDSLRVSLLEKYGARSNHLGKTMYDAYLDNDGNYQCRNVQILRVINHQLNLLFRSLDIYADLDKLFKKPKGTPPNGHVLDIIKGSIPKITVNFKSDLPTE